MNLAETRDFHEHEAIRFRELAAKATTAPLKARLAERAEEHERLAGAPSSRSKLANEGRTAASI
jgi:hypothetical protein